MADWSAGYVADIDYTHGYYEELNPLRIKMAFLNAGLASPEVGVACELGFGQGISTNMHAAASITRWYGTDFNPSQAGFAREMALQAGGKAQLYDEAFDEFLKRSDLPDFDFIGLHGIWSWVSDANRQVIVEFLRRKLKVGGVLYISYNTLPGWASFAPMRHLLATHARSQAAEGGGIVKQINDSLEFGNALLATKPGFARANPSVTQRFEQLQSQNRHYLAHEYFNRDWLPMHFSTMGEWLETAKLQFACSAHYLDHFDPINLSAEQKAFLDAIPDRMFRETVRDFMVNQQFRRDYWVKGLRKLSPLEINEQKEKIRVVLVKHPQNIAFKSSANGKEFSLSEAIYKPLIELLSDHRPHALGDIVQALAPQGIRLNMVSEAIMVLSGLGNVAFAQEDEVTGQCVETTSRLNAYIETKARSSAEIQYLASPVTGGGVVVDRFSELFLKAVGEGHEGTDALANYAWKILEAQGQRLVKNGETISDAAACLAEMRNYASEFTSKKLPILRALKVV
jgi:SAM-dependent methyltransferase